MDLDEATRLTVGSAKTYILDELRKFLAEAHASAPQRALLASHACDSIEAGLHQLAQLGHRFELVDQGTPAGSEFPKMLYRGSETMTVEDEDEAHDAKNEGWSEQQSTAEALTPADTPPVPTPTYEDDTSATSTDTSSTTAADTSSAP